MSANFPREVASPALARTLPSEGPAKSVSLASELKSPEHYAMLDRAESLRRSCTSEAAWPAAGSASSQLSCHTYTAIPN